LIFTRKNGHQYTSRGKSNEEVFGRVQEEAACLVLESGTSQSNVARHLKVNVNSLADWIKKAKTTLYYH
jgi:hypothetical protein